MQAFKSMSIDELWHLHEELISTLARKLAEEKAKLENRLRFLGNSSSAISSNRKRRAYPRVLPKYRNPDQPSETWSGRGKQPRWLAAQLRSGKRIGDFLIAQPRSGKRGR